MSASSHRSSRTMLATRPSAFAARSRPAAAPRASRSVRIMASSVHGLAAKTLEGQDFSFDQLKGKVALITNVACACGLTNSNYKELVALHSKYGDKGLVIMAFPCNQFGAQESGSAQQIREEKVDVNGPKTHPVFKALKSGCAGCDGDIDWNFRGKFLVDKNGTVVLRSADNPLSLEPKIQELLAA